MEDHSFQEVVGSNPKSIPILEGHDNFALIWCINCIVCLKRLNINEKEARVGPFKESILVRFDEIVKHFYYSLYALLTLKMFKI